MAKNCKNSNSISRYALLLIMVAGSTAAFADEFEPVISPAVRQVITAETEVRNKILEDIDAQKDIIEQKLDKEEFPEAASACDALLRQLSTMPGSKAKAKLESMQKFRNSIRRQWTAYVLEKSHDLYDEKKYEEAIALCSTINIIDEQNGADISTPFIKKCQDAIKAREYRDAIDINKFESDFENNLKTIDRLMRQAQTYYKNGKYESVVEVLEKVYLIDPFNVRATTLLDKTYGKIYSNARARHRVTTQQMLAQLEWDWVMPVRSVKQQPEIATRSAEIKVAENPVEAKMEKIIFPKFDSPGMDIKKILTFLHTQSIANDPDGKGVTIIPQIPPEELKAQKFQKIYMRFSNIPLSDILRYLCLNLGINYKINNFGEVVVGTNVDNVSKDVHKFPIRNELIADIIGGDAAAAPAAAPAAPDETGDAGADPAAAPASGSSGSGTEAALKKYFSDRGVDFPVGSTIRYNSRAHRLEVTNSESNLRRLDELLRQLNSIEVPMVMTEIKFVEVSENDFNQLGFDWNFSLSDSGRSNGLWNFTTGTNFVTQEDQNTKPSAFIQNLNLLPNFDEDWGGLKPSLNVTVHALSQNDNVEVLTTPRLISKSGYQASIRMVTETRYPDSWEAPEIETESDNITTISFPVPDLGEATPIGITLTVTPTVGPDNNTIDLDLHPQITTFLGSENSGYPVPVQQGVVNRETGAMVPSMLNETFNIWMPELGKRSIDAKVRVKDGETIVLGGIISNSIERREEKMPILGSIPLFGRLFQNRTEESSKTNLLIFVTARLISTNDGRPVKSLENNGTPHFNF